MSELTDALRKFADAIDAGQGVAGATECAVVLHDGKGRYSATYIGRSVPHNMAGIHMLASGIQNFNQTAAAQGMQATRGSTH